MEFNYYQEEHMCEALNHAVENLRDIHIKRHLDSCLLWFLLDTNVYRHLGDNYDGLITVYVGGSE